jgi:hypothetical protein
MFSSTTALVPPHPTCLSNQLILANLKKIIQSEAHRYDLHDKIIRDTGWSIKQFHSIDWLAHEKAFLSLGRLRQISLCKIIHNLLCTNVKQERYYGHSNLCPCCNALSKTMVHLLTCPSDVALTIQQTAQQELYKMETPTPIITAIPFGLSHLANPALILLHMVQSTPLTCWLPNISCTKLP